jgi:hypothetical protein
VHELFVALLIASVASCAICVSALLWVRWRMRLYLRIRPSSRSLAPTGWALSTSEPARLHRRLRRVAASARVAGSQGDPAAALVATQIEDEAVRLEACLVALSRVWRVERPARKELTNEIVELEHLTVRLATSASATRAAALGAGSVDAMSALRERLEALEEARVELNTVDQQAGLRFG